LVDGVTKTEATKIIAHHSQDEANFLYRDVKAELSGLMHLPIPERLGLISDIEAMLNEFKFRTENERCIRA
jgi:hypothetical protein